MGAAGAAAAAEHERRQARGHVHFAASVPVIILSNLGQESDVQRALDGGARSYLIKASLSLDELVTRTQEVLKG